MSTNKGKSPPKHMPSSNNSKSYSPKNKNECIDASIKNHREKQPSAGGMDIGVGDPEKGTGSATTQS